MGSVQLTFALLVPPLTGRAEERPAWSLKGRVLWPTVISNPLPNEFLYCICGIGSKVFLGNSHVTNGLIGHIFSKIYLPGGPWV